MCRPAGTELVSIRREAHADRRGFRHWKSMSEMKAGIAGLERSSLGDEIVDRVNLLGAISEAPGHLARIFLTKEHRAAAELILAWMREAGMSAHLDAVGNVCGRYEGEVAGLPCLMLGSHYDTVRDAGKWDGPLGLITAISCVADLQKSARRLPFAIEVTGFADEEGVRFASTLLGSRAVAGTFDESVLGVKDRAGISMRDALSQFGLDPDHIGAAARARSELLGYVELHIEQGPVLEAQNLPVGVVTAISGATRLAASLTGMAGHAGTVPMALRRDALAPLNASSRSRNFAKPIKAHWSARSVTFMRCLARPMSFRGRYRSPSTFVLRQTRIVSSRWPISSGGSRRSPSVAAWCCRST
jgi:allantoate deiminase